MENGGGTGEQARRQAEHLAKTVQDRVEGMRGYAEDAGEWIREFAREKPVLAVAVAAGLGFVVGRLFSKT